MSNRWGNATTRRSYDCLTELSSSSKCHRARRCKSCKKLSEAGAIQKPCCKVPKEWWGMFLDLSDVGSEIDDRSQTSTETNPQVVQSDERRDEVNN